MPIAETSVFTGSGGAVPADTAVVIVDTVDLLALFIFADISTAAIGIPAAAGDALIIFANLPFTAVLISSTADLDALILRADQASGAVIGGAASVNTASILADLTPLALAVVGADRLEVDAFVGAANFSCRTIGISAATFCTGSALFGANLTGWTIGVGSASADLAPAVDAQLAFIAVVIAVAAPTALVLMADVSPLAVAVAAASPDAPVFEAVFANTAVLIRCTADRSGRRLYRSAVVISAVAIVSIVISVVAIVSVISVASVVSVISVVAIISVVAVIIFPLLGIAKAADAVV